MPNNTTSKQEIAWRLRSTRAALGLTMAELSRRTRGEIAQETISRIERGRASLGYLQARRLATALGSVTVIELLGLEDAVTDLTADEKNLIAQYRLTDPTGRLRILESSDRFGKRT